MAWTHAVRGGDFDVIVMRRKKDRTRCFLSCYETVCLLRKALVNPKRVAVNHVAYFFVVPILFFHIEGRWSLPRNEGKQTALARRKENAKKGNGSRFSIFISLGDVKFGYVPARPCFFCSA